MAHTPTEPSARRVYTLGHSSRSAEEVIAALREAGVEVVADVRSAPWSRRYPQYAKEQLERSLAEAGIGYRWLGATLGGLRAGGYAEHQRSAEYAEGLAALIEGLETPTALFCAERDPRQCHRHHIADDLVRRGWAVWHVLEPGELIPHQSSLAFE